MIAALDSNVILRYIVRDDETQYYKAVKLLEQSEYKTFKVNLVVITEVWWVLEHIYYYSKEELIEAFQILLSAKELNFEKYNSVSRALNLYKYNKADFEDCLIAQLNSDSEVLPTITFDKKASTLSGMQLLK